MIRPPICLIAHRRPAHLARCLASLGACRGAAGSDVFVFVDGPRDSTEADLTRQTAFVARSARGFRRVVVVERDFNFGMSAAVLASVGRVLDEADSAIVVEEDLVVASAFLDFMAHALATYADAPRAFGVSGYLFSDLREQLGSGAFFSRRPCCWGWGVWRRAWGRLIPSRGLLLDRIAAAGLESVLDPPGAMSMTRKLRAGLDGKDDSWSPMWYATVALESGLFLYPPASLVANTGFDGSGGHGWTTRAFDTMLWDTSASPTLPAVVKEADGVDEVFLAHFRAAQAARDA